MEIKVTVELGEKTFGILEKLFGVNQMIMPNVAEPIRPIITAEDSKAITQPVAPIQPAQAAAVGTQPAQPVMPAATVTTQPATAVPTAAAPVYTLESLTAAAGTLIDNPAKLAELQGLMQSYGVNALSEIPQDKYPEIAFALRGMGANI